MATFTINLDGGLQLTKSLAEAINLPTIFKEEMLNVRARLIADTQSGKDAEGGGLKPYSRSYTEAIDSGRVFGKAPGNHTPNLTATGQLMRAMQIEASGLEVKMFFQGTHSKSKRVGEKTAKKKRKDAEKAGHELHTRSNRGISGGGKSLGTGKKRGSGGGGGGDVPNASIARFQYEMGRDGWFQFADRDIDRILKRIQDALFNLRFFGRP